MGMMVRITHDHHWAMHEKHDPKRTATITLHLAVLYIALSHNIPTFVAGTMCRQTSSPAESFLEYLRYCNLRGLWAETKGATLERC